MMSFIGYPIKENRAFDEDDRLEVNPFFVYRQWPQIAEVSHSLKTLPRHSEETAYRAT